MFDEQRLRAFGGLIVRMQHGGALTREETRGAFAQIFKAEQPDLMAGVFIEALRHKGQSADEMAGLIDAHNEDWLAHCPGDIETPEPHVSIVGVGMDTLKTINISSGAAIIAAACGLYVHKVGAPGMSGVSGAADAFMMMGVDPFVPWDRMRHAITASRLAFTAVMSPHLQQTGVFRVLSQMRCGTSMHRAGPLALHSANERHKVTGVPHPDYVRRSVEVMQRVGYRRGLAVCGRSPEHPDRYMDEISTVGSTQVAELHDDGSISEYEVTPQSMGLPVGRYEEIASSKTAPENVHRLALALAGRGSPAIVDILAANAASCLKLMGKVPDLATGVAQARAAVKSGAAIEQVRACIRAQNPEPAKGLAQLDALLAG